jgi:hypothetical protein
MRKFLIGLIVLLIIAMGALSFYHFFYSEGLGLTFVTIDINPSVELSVNNSDKVIDVVPLNEDADIIISDLDLVGSTIEEASEQIVDAATETGYINELSDENTILVSSYSDNEDKRKVIQEKIISNLNKKLDAKKTAALVVVQGMSDALKAEAVQYDVSNGKMLLIEKATELSDDLNKEELVDLSIKEIHQKIKDYNEERYVKMNKDQNQIKVLYSQKKLQKIQAKTTVLNQVKEQLWSEYKNTGESIDLSKKEEIVNEIIEERKEVLKQKIDNFKEELEEPGNTVDGDSATTNNYPVIKERYEQIKQRLKTKMDETQSDTDMNFPEVNIDIEE